MKPAIHPETENAICEAELRIGEARRLRKCLLSPQYQGMIKAIESLPLNKFRVNYRGEISLSLWKQPAFTWGDNPALAEIIETLSDLTGVLPESSDFPADLTRMYTWEFRIRGVELPLYLHVTLAEDGVCRRVQTGKKVVEAIEYIEKEVPVYEFVC